MIFELEAIREGKTQMKFSEVKRILNLQPALTQYNDRIIPKHLQSQNNTNSLLQLLISYQGQVTLKGLFGWFFWGECFVFFFPKPLLSIISHYHYLTEDRVVALPPNLHLYVTEAEKNLLPFYRIPDKRGK